MAGKIVTIAQQKGGVGKTMIATHLAVCWALIDRRSVAVLDLDPQGSLGQWFEARENWLGEDATGLTFRTSSGWGARREALALARDHDYVLIDTPPHAELEAKQAFRPATLAVVPVQPAALDLWATAPTLDMAGAEDTPVVFVLNRVVARARLTETMLGEFEKLGARVASSRIGNRVAFAEAIGKGGTVIESRPNGTAAAEIRALATEIAELAADG